MCGNPSVFERLVCIKRSEATTILQGKSKLKLHCQRFFYADACADNRGKFNRRLLASCVINSTRNLCNKITIAGGGW